MNRISNSPLKHKERDIEAHRLSSGYASQEQWHKKYNDDGTEKVEKISTLKKEPVKPASQRINQATSTKDSNAKIDHRYGLNIQNYIDSGKYTPDEIEKIRKRLTNMTTPMGAKPTLTGGSIASQSGIPQSYLDDLTEDGRLKDEASGKPSVGDQIVIDDVHGSSDASQVTKRMTAGAIAEYFKMSKEDVPYYNYEYSDAYDGGVKLTLKQLDGEGLEANFLKVLEDPMSSYYNKHQSFRALQAKVYKELC